MKSESLSLATLRIFLRHMKPYRVTFAFVMFFVLLATGIEVYRPWLYRALLNIFAIGPSALDSAIPIFVLLIALGGASLLLRRAGDLLGVRYQSKTKQALQQTCFTAIHRQSYEFFTNEFSGSLVKRANRYDTAFEQLADQMTWGVGGTIIRVIVTLIAIAFYKPSFALLFAAWIVVYAIYIFYTVRWKRPFDLAKAEMDSKFTGWLADTVSNFANIQLFASRRREERLFAQKTEEMKEKLVASWQASVRLDTGQAILVWILEFAVMGSAVWLWSKGQMSVGDLGLLQLYTGQINGRLWDLGRQLKSINQALADANEMTQVILREPTVGDVPGAKPLTVSGGMVVFNSVSFGYQDGSRVLKNFDLTIAPGEKISFVGPSGGGKSTVTKLLLRLYDLTSGAIEIDGHDIAKITQTSLRESISLVPQEPILFHRTLLENIRYGRPEATEVEVTHAARQAHAHEFIAKSPQGYHTLVGERGIKLSGGERQRIAIARAILKNAPILVLDEATSSLDSESESLIQDALKTLMKGKTVIVIAHRLSTIMQMDRIVVLERGAIAEQGKHAELIKAQEGTYQKLWEIQAGGFS